MKAAVLESVGYPVVLRGVPAPQIATDEVSVQTRTTGICGTDLHVLDSDGHGPALPYVLDHEPEGVVASVGSSAERRKLGAQLELESVSFRNGTQDLAEAIRLIKFSEVRPSIAACDQQERVNEALQRLCKGVAGCVVVQVRSN